MVMVVPLADCCKERTAVKEQDHEEARWIERARQGDSAGHARLLVRYRHRAVRLAALTLRNPSDGEDAAQDAFIRAFQKLHTLREGSSFQAWLFRIVVRTCLNRMKASRWKLEVIGSEVSGLAASTYPGFAPADNRMMVRMLLDALTPPLRAALVLREMEGLDYEQISQVLGVPVGTVRSRLNAARSRFRQLWVAAAKETENV